ncbi:protein MCM10 homolog [Periophthalmus magnuspinnatus]|uniref:protein MCM10 homolog n=1 Tax=Periophthalmus magnuspinnatus TaxID=409849 RepID=UPI002436346E|nr:protein MCM10 homolog [Periophthalmus magnuspinnatus]
MDGEDDLDILTALLEESEGVEQQQNQADDLNDLFDEENDGEEYKDGAEERDDQLSELFGDVEDMEKEEENKEEVSESLNRSREDLQDELKRMQEQMKKLQQQLEMSQSSFTSKSPVSPNSPSQQKTSKPNLPKPAPVQKTKAPGDTTSTPLRKVQESSDFSAQLSNADSFIKKPRVAHQPKTRTSPESRGPLMEIKLGSSFQPMETPAANPLRSQSFNTRPGSVAGCGASSGTSGGSTRPSALPILPKDVAVEKYSGLRLRKPRVSSSDMDHKMADRRLIRLSSVPERLTREKLEESDWVTFAVVVSKVTPQSSNSGKTFSIWKLNDLHNLEVFVSLLLFGEVHKEHWKTEPGTVIGLLNPNPMKQKEGYNGVSLTVDHPQKVLLMGEAQDYGTCKGVKKNGEPCSQIVNMYECQFCQYHVKAQYKKMSSKRAELQSSFSGKAPNKFKGKGSNLREKLCQDGFYYGGVSSAACAASIGASKPTKPGQKTLDKLFVKGSTRHVAQAKRLAMQSGDVSGCSDEFKSLMSAPTPGALQLKKHLTQNKTVVKNPEGSPVQSISAADLLKQQKQKQRDLLTARRQRNALLSPKSPSLSPATLSTPSAPTLGRGFSEGDDILFFDNSPPSAPAQSTMSLSAAKMAALKKLRAKGMGLEKEDPNAVKRKRSNSSEISARVEKNCTLPKDGSSNEEEEPAQKKRKEQQEYIQSEEFQKILNAKSRHNAVLQAAEYQLQERYFDALVKKEQMEDKMKGIREMKCRAVTCKKCNYTYFKPADRCVGENHDLKWHDAVKRFFKCPCGQRAIALDRLPNKHCSNCGLFKWERDGMLKEKTGPKIGRELLLPRGEEHGKFLNSMK